ncbi:hypothetical protein LX15_006139 [Streptoalloteichus tenebrarius]|uniref:Secreted protein n=1 Tax=Streptoalloteichus tenebrarius (strain ATCC 17920 / DSM 40477 / JCM 4838 / CBS 697.72 / NBRC 16177 / NCIMB 11028 / NRRL B-12390 / A12253. 1 / ISP 5477) TaxID=1933 RepID=A0ABT1I3N4_STRSD|nr:hypothetical protein [Streptoalloteichus tenebrarius]
MKSCVDSAVASAVALAVISAEPAVAVAEGGLTTGRSRVVFGAVSGVMSSVVGCEGGGRGRRRRPGGAGDLVHRQHSRREGQHEQREAEPGAGVRVVPVADHGRQPSRGRSGRSRHELADYM